MRYYILIKRKGTKKWLGAIPAKKGVSKSKLIQLFSRKLKKGFTYRIITQAQLKRYLARLVPKGIRRIKGSKRRKIRKRRRKGTVKRRKKKKR